MDDVSQRWSETVERLDSVEQIRQLLTRYAKAVDTTDYVLLGSLFVHDVRSPVRSATGEIEILVGREHLQDWYASAPEMQRAHFHFMGSPMIEFSDSGNASGEVYCFAATQQEDGRFWQSRVFKYCDRYRRDEGRWLFVSRKPIGWLSTTFSAEAAGSLMAGL